jgi:hypothetical protein
MAVTITYQYPVTGTTPPTGVSFGAVNAFLNWADADTVAVITHNLPGITAAQNTQLWPVVISEYDSSNAGTVYGVVSVLKGPAIVTLAKASAAGTGGTLQVAIFSPNSLIR